MNALTLGLAWLAVQIAVVAVPALAIQAFASRRGPALGAWAAAVGLGLVLFLSVIALLPRFEIPALDGIQSPRPVAIAAGSRPEHMEPSARAEGVRLPAVAEFLEFWRGLERGAAAPAATGPGVWLGAVVLAGMGLGLARIVIGIAAIERLRRRARLVHDPDMIALVAETRAAMGWNRPVDIRETGEIGTAATAGWSRPVVLLPLDWRDWTPAERRAVAAHELAHIERRDYAVGLAARMVLALHYYHPLVRWLAARLTLEQELAADALAANHAGGRPGYLAALSGLALRRDGRSPRWPARAFLTGRGTLIRRIAMLRDNDRVESQHAGWRGLAAVALATLTLAVAAVRAPARPDDQSPAPDRQAVTAPIVFRDDVAGAVVVRPAAAVRRPGVDRLLSPLVSESLDEVLGMVCFLNGKKVAPKIACKDLEWLTCYLDLGRNRDPQGKELHSLQCGSLAVRAVGPFDWLEFVRLCGFQAVPAGDAGRGYYRLEGKAGKAVLGSNPCLYLADDRTAWIDQEWHVKKYLSREDHAPPAFPSGPEWERASRGLAAVAIDNHDGSFLKGYNLGRPDDAVVLALFKDVERLVFSVDDADEIGLRVHAACRPGDGSAAASRMIESLVKSGTVFLEHAPPADSKDDSEDRMARSLLANVRVEHTDRTVDVRARGFWRIDELAAMVEAEMKCKRKAVNAQAKAASKTKTR